jgi:dihydroneopterin aldolase
MKYTTSLQNLEFYAYHGLYEAEKRIGAYFYVTIEVESTVKEGISITEIDQTINYETLYRIISNEMQHREDLLETIAQKIITQIRKHFGNISAIRIQIEKPKAAGLLPTGKAVVKLEWIRDEL